MRKELGKPKKLFQSIVKSLVKVIQKQMWFDLITTRTPEKDSSTTQCYVGSPVENCQTWKMIQTHSYHLLCPACCSRGFRHILLFRVGVSHVPGIEYRPGGWVGGGIRGPMLSSLFTGPLEINKKMMALVDTGTKCTLIYGNPQKISGPLSNIKGFPDSASHNESAC